MQNVTANLAFRVVAAVNKTLPCHYTRHLSQSKFVLLIVLTPALCIFGLLGNAANIVIFTKKKMRSTNNFLLTALAVCDIGVLVSALLLYSIEVAYDYYDSLKLYHAWLFYLKFMFFLSHVFQMGAVYMTIAATFERFLVTSFPKVAYRMCQQANCWITIVVVVLWSLTLNATKFFEVDIVHKPWCPRWAEYALRPSKLAENPIYDQVYTTWLQNLLGMILPFILLSGLNLIIVISMKHSPSDSPSAFISASMDVSMIRRQSRVRLRAKRREATIILLVVVFVFLICNTPGFVLNVWEKIDQTYLNDHRSFYGGIKDAITILTIVNSVANFIVYIIFGNEFRKELKKLLCPNTAEAEPVSSAIHSEASSKQNLVLYLPQNSDSNANLAVPDSHLVGQNKRRVTIDDTVIEVELLENGEIRDKSGKAFTTVTVAVDDNSPIQCICGCSPGDQCRVGAATRL